MIVGYGRMKLVGHKHFNTLKIEMVGAHGKALRRMGADKARNARDS